MPLHIDRDRLDFALVSLLARTILPSLEDGTARMHADAALNLLIRNVLVPLRVTTPPAVEGADVAAMLEADQAQRQELSGLNSAMFKALAAGEADVLPPPTAEQLTALMRGLRKRPDQIVTGVQTLAGGNSKQTVLFEVDGEPLVMRRDHPADFVGTTVAREFAVLRGLYRAGFIVPEQLYLDTSGEVLSGAVMIGRKVAGRAAGDSKGPTAAAGVDPLGMMADVMARLHAINPRGIAAPGITDIVWDEAALLAQIDQWRAFYRRAVAEPIVVVEMAFDWLVRHAAQGVQRAAIVHGDNGYHNLLAEDGVATALLDWELVHVGSAAEDLGYLKGQVERSGKFEDFLAAYEQAGGERPPQAALHYYYIYHLTRNAGIYAAAVGAFNAGKVDHLPLAATSSFLFEGAVKKLGELMRAELARA